MKIDYLTDIGNKRSTNEDSIGIEYNQIGHTLALVADGMGGHNAGEVASAMAKNLMINKFKEIKDNIDYKKFLENTIKDINTEIYEKSLINTEYSKMGTTLSVIIDTGERIYIGHIGDSRIYYTNSRYIRQLTKDHTIVQMLYEEGEISKEEISTHPYRNVLMQSLGPSKNIIVDILELEIPKDGYILLCSDGLTADLTDQEIFQIVHTTEDISIKNQKLIKSALKKGGNDNISVILMERE